MTQECLCEYSQSIFPVCTCFVHKNTLYPRWRGGVTRSPSPYSAVENLAQRQRPTFESTPSGHAFTTIESSFIDPRRVKYADPATINRVLIVEHVYRSLYSTYVPCNEKSMMFEWWHKSMSALGDTVSCSPDKWLWIVIPRGARIKCYVWIP